MVAYVAQWLQMWVGKKSQLVVVECCLLVEVADDFDELLAHVMERLRYSSVAVCFHVAVGEERQDAVASPKERKLLFIRKEYETVVSVSKSFRFAVSTRVCG